MSDQDRREEVDEVINDIDEVKTAVEELRDTAPPDEQAALDKMRAGAR